MNIQVYLNTANKDYQKEILSKFHLGILSCADESLLNDTDQIHDCDFSIIYAYATLTVTTGMHGLRREILNQTNSKTICIDAGYFRQNGGIPYYRVALNSPLLHEGEFFHLNSPDDRWNALQTSLNIDIVPRTYNDGYILICMQPKAWGLNDTDKIPLTLATEWITEIRKHTSRDIIIRTHPGHYETDIHQLCDKFSNVCISDGKMSSFEEDLNGCNTLVTHSSTTAIEAALVGKPVFTVSPGSMAYPISCGPLSNIENPPHIDIQQWLNDLAYTIWTPDEIENGLPWLHFKKGLKL